MGATPSFPATDMLQPAWMAARVQDMRLSYRCDDARICATVWWYSASSVLVDGPIRGSEVIPDTALNGASCVLIDSGYLGGIDYQGVRAVDQDGLAASLVTVLTPLIEVLSSVSGATERSLWAITTDSIANRTLDVHTTGDAAMALVTQMRQLGTVMPLPRFVDTPNGLVTRRASCCLIYLTQFAHMCGSCPRTPRTYQSG